MNKDNKLVGYAKSAVYIATCWVALYYIVKWWVNR